MFNLAFLWAMSLNPIVWATTLVKICTEWAQGPYGVWALFGVAFGEASFFPVPPDLLLVVWGVAPENHQAVLWIAIAVGLMSCVGGCFGYMIGYVGGRPLLEWMCTKPWLHWLMHRERLEMVDRAFEKWGTMAIIVAAMTPIPYKVFTISAGAAKMNFRHFILGSIIGRMPRFIVEGVLLYFFGEWVRKTFEAQMELWFTLLAVLVIGGFLLIGRLKHAVPAAEAKTGPAGEAGVGAKSAAPVLAPVKSTEASGGGCSGAGGVGLGRCALRRTKQRQ